MSNRSIGLAFLAIGAFLFAMRYVAAAIYISGGPSKDSRLFAHGLDFVGSLPLTLATVSAILGCVFFVRGELDQRKSSRE